MSPQQICMSLIYLIFSIFFLIFKIFQNKFYIESKLNRDLSEELMKLFADHVAEKHVNTLMRECTPSFGPGGLEKNGKCL